MVPHKMTVVRVMVVALIALAGVRGSSAQLPTAIEEEARRIENMLIAPCCFTQQVSQHQSEASEQVRQDIRVRLKGGETRDQILGAYVDQYGKRILAEPEMKGFGVLAIAVPAVLLALTGWGLAIVLHRFARARPSGPQPAAETVPPSLVERLDTELRDLD